MRTRRQFCAPLKGGCCEKRVTKRLLRSLYHTENSEPEFLVHWPANVPVNLATPYKTPPIFDGGIATRKIPASFPRRTSTTQTQTQSEALYQPRRRNRYQISVSPKKKKQITGFCHRWITFLFCHRWIT
jgi:hypothetical protein